MEEDHMGKLLIKTLATLVILAGLSGAAAAEEFFRIGSGLAGTYPLFGAKLAELINSNIPGLKAATISGGSEANQVKIEKGEVQAMISYTFVVKRIHDGKGALNFPTPGARHVMTLYGSSMMPIAQKDSGITSLAQLKEKPHRIWRGSRASVFFPLITEALAAHGVSEDDVNKVGGIIESFGYRDTVQAFQDGRLDVAFYAGPTPYSLMLQLESNPGYNLLSFGDKALENMATALPGLGRTVIPAGTYKGQTADAHVPYFVNQLIVGAQVPEETVYKVTKLMNEQFKAFHGIFPGAEEILPDEPLAYNQVPIHPGAERYYREVGKLK
jgi:TRAP transporter TAXI family solute receptor